MSQRPNPLARSRPTAEGTGQNQANSAAAAVVAPNDQGELVNRRVEYNDSYPPCSVIHMTFAARDGMPPVKLHWYDGGILPERPDDLEP